MTFTTDIVSIPITEKSGGYTLSVEIPSEAPYLEGHFPGDPLVPAAQLLAWLQVAVARVDPRLQTAGRFDRVKFLAPVRGESLLTLEWTPTPDGWTVLARVGEKIALKADLLPDAS